MPLTDAAIRSAKPAEGRFELVDGDGLGIVVLPSGVKTWRLRYRTLAGVRKVVSLGRYPDVGLTKARKKASELRDRVRDGGDPAAERAELRVRGEALADVVATYLAENRPAWKTSTGRTYTSAINTFTTWAATAKIVLAADLTAGDLARYRAHAITVPRRVKAKGGGRADVVSTGQRRSAAAVNCDLRAVKTMLQALRKAGRLHSIDASDAIKDNLELVQIEQTRPDPLKPVDLRQLLAACARHDAEMWTITREEHGGGRDVGTTPRHEPIAPLVMVMLLTGMRLGEALALTWDDVDLDDQLIRVLPGKTWRERSVDLTVSPALVQLLEAMRSQNGTGQVFDHTQPTALDARHRLIEEYAAPPFLWSTRHSRPGERSAPTLRSTCGCYLTCAPAIFGAASVYRSAAQLGHSVQVAERHYLGTLRRIPASATTLEVAMEIEAELDGLIRPIAST